MEKVNMRKVFLSIIVCVFLCSCASSRYAMSAAIESSSSVLPNVDFSKYTFATVRFDSSIGPIALDIQIPIQDILTSVGYTVIGDARIGTLSDEDQSKTFIVTMGTRNESETAVVSTQYSAYAVTSRYTYCTIQIIDYVSGSIIASINGSHGGLYVYPIEAIRAGIAEMKKVIKKDNYEREFSMPTQNHGEE